MLCLVGEHIHLSMIFPLSSIHFASISPRMAALLMPGLAQLSALCTHRSTSLHFPTIFARQEDVPRSHNLCLTLGPYP